MTLVIGTTKYVNKKKKTKKKKMEPIGICMVCFHKPPTGKCLLCGFDVKKDKVEDQKWLSRQEWLAETKEQMKRFNQSKLSVRGALNKLEEEVKNCIFEE